MIFDKLSPTADFISKIQLDLDIVNKNVLYITHMQDKILKIVKELELNWRMQREITEFYNKGEAHLEPDSEDSAQ